MKPCTQCQAQLKDDALFCATCGAKQEADISPAPWSSPDEAQAAPEHVSQSQPETLQDRAEKPPQPQVMSWNVPPTKKKSPAKLIGILSACAAVAVVGVVAALLLFSSPAKNVEKAMRNAVNGEKGGIVELLTSNIVNEKKANALFGMDVLNKLSVSPSQVEFRADFSSLADVTVNGLFQSDPANARMLSELTANAMGESFDLSFFLDKSEFYLLFPLLSSKALYINFDTFAAQWNDSMFGGYYTFTEEELAMIQSMTDALELYNPNAAPEQDEKLTAMGNRFLDALVYEDTKEELPSGGDALDCVVITVPKEAVITLMEDIMDYAGEILELLQENGSLDSLMASTGLYEDMDYAAELENAKAQMRAELQSADMDIQLKVFTEKNVSRCVSAEITTTSYGTETKLIAYIETEDAANPMANWEAAFMGYEDGLEMGFLKAQGSYSYSEANGHKHSIRLSESDSSSPMNLELSWNPAQSTNNFFLGLNADEATLELHGNYYVDKDSVTMGVNKITYEDAYTAKESYVFDVWLKISPIDAIQAPDYTTDKLDFLTLTEQDLMEIIANSPLAGLLAVGY